MDRHLLDDLIKIQTEDPSTKTDPYMKGLANGLIVAKAVVTGEELQDGDLVETIVDMQNQLTEVSWRQMAGGVALAGALMTGNPDTAVAKDKYVVELPAKQQARVAPNFTAKEFACPCCGVRKVDGRLLYKLELLRVKLGNKPIKITSGYRCPKHNKEVGGAKHSQHMNGTAADIEVEGYTPEQVAKAAKEVGFAYVQTYPGKTKHTHVDVR
jgi:uncharacterized protein YcbK (DUF882 family)